MMLIHGNTTIEYGMTPSGMFFENHKINGKNGVLRLTPNPEKFLRWMIQSEVDADIEERQINVLIQILKGWWERKDHINIRGTFNGEHYKRFLNAKKLQS